MTAAPYNGVVPASVTQPDDVCEVACVHPESVAKAKQALPDELCVDRATSFLKLVADQTRLKMVSALHASELCVCDLAAVVGITESAVSHQLRLLRTGRVVTSRKEGRVVYYRLLDSHVTTLIENALEHARE
ncbi:transcriptional repressor SmtB homolog [Deinococcus xinjiangensis]|uniref:Transcriptional repressor SmtB homolog n=1 Tax=Deinococcus xinjiangensis TaxID=457454 RepID=A0ABP9VF64_9DEIO|nr:metalloregulator ArsR/SmtB family transcription factor [Deinococcus fonticola]